MSDEPSPTAGTDGTDNERQFSRRQVLAATGVTGLGGGLGGYVLANGIDETLGLEPECDPPPLSRHDDGWPKPATDLGNTGQVPAVQAPDSLTVTWGQDREPTRFREPIVVNGTVLLSEVVLDSRARDNERGRLRALSLSTGMERWRTTAPSWSSSPGHVLVAGDSVFFRYEDGVAAVALADGSMLWEQPSVGPDETYVSSYPLVLDGLVHLPQFSDRGYRIDRFDARTGTHCGSQTVDIDVDVFLQPLGLSRTDQFLGTSDAVIALGRDDLSVRWREPVTARPHGAPRIRDGRVFVPGFAGQLVALDAVTGERLWTEEFDHYVPGGRSGETVYAEPTPKFGAVTSEAVVVREDVYSEFSHRIKAFDPASGDLLWERTPPAERGYRYAAPVAAGEAVYTIEFSHDREDYRLLELVDGTGEQRAERRLDIEGGAELVVTAGRLVVVSHESVRVLGAGP